MKDRNLNSQGNNPSNNGLSQTDKRWFAVYTRFKSEKYILDKLTKKGIEAYVPLLKYTKRYERKIKHVEIPLISCYVFVRISESDYVKVLQTEHVVRFLKLHGQLISIPEDEMELMKRVVGENVVEKAHEGKLSKGTEVEVIGGNLTGLKGKIIKQQNKKFFVVALDNIGYSLELNIAKEFLQPTRRLSSIGQKD